MLNLRFVHATETIVAKPVYMVRTAATDRESSSGKERQGKQLLMRAVLFDVCATPLPHPPPATAARRRSAAAARPLPQVTIPAVSGVMGVLGDHAPTIAQLKPGVVTVHGADINDVTHKYFVSGGFAVVKGDSSATVTTVDAVKFEDLDAGLARKNLDEAQAALLKATTDLEKVRKK